MLMKEKLQLTQYHLSPHEILYEKITEDRKSDIGRYNLDENKNQYIFQFQGVEACLKREMR